MTFVTGFATSGTIAAGIIDRDDGWDWWRGHGNAPAVDLDLSTSRYLDPAATGGGEGHRQRCGKQADRDQIAGLEHDTSCNDAALEPGVLHPNRTVGKRGFDYQTTDATRKPTLQCY